MADNPKSSTEKAADKAADKAAVTKAVEDAAEQAERDRLASVAPVSGPVDMNRLGESSDPEVHRRLARIEALQQNRRQMVPAVDPEALKAIDAQIALEYRAIETMNDPKYIQLRAERASAAAAGNAKRVGEIDEELGR